MPSYAWFLVSLAVGVSPSLALAPTPLSLAPNTIWSVPVAPFSEEAHISQDSVVSSGRFNRIDRSHWAEGDVQLRRSDDGVVLEFGDGFTAAAGPDLRVLLSPHADPRNASQLGAFIELGTLASNYGSQVYVVPSNVDLTDVRSVVIYCHPYEVVFSTATMASP